MKFFLELYESLPRGGPGDNKSTEKAYKYLKQKPIKPQILDIGCGPGIQTLELARISNGFITALDNYQPFLDSVIIKAKEKNLSKNIHCINQSMLDMDFNPESFDVIWS